MKNQYQDNETFEFVPTSNVASGSLVLVEKYVGIAATDVAANTTGVAVKFGKFVLPKANVAISQGAAVYWDGTNAKVTTSSSGNTLIGVAAKAAASADTTVIVDLNYRGSL